MYNFDQCVHRSEITAVNQQAEDVSIVVVLWILCG